MRKTKLETTLESLPASELAALAGTSLGRGRPSAAKREALKSAVRAAIATKQVTVKRDGRLVRN